MTSKVTVTAQSHDAEVRVMPRTGDRELWDSLSEETKRFALHRVPKGEVREFSIHKGQSVFVREVADNKTFTVDGRSISTILNEINAPQIAALVPNFGRDRTILLLQGGNENVVVADDPISLVGDEVFVSFPNGRVAK